MGMLYVLDEPITGLHFADIDRLLDSLHRLVESGHSVVVIEHDLDVIKTADYVIDLGPEGGHKGGELITCGAPDYLRSSGRDRSLQEVAHGKVPRQLLVTIVQGMQLSA